MSAFSSAAAACVLVLGSLLVACTVADQNPAADHQSGAGTSATAGTATSNVGGGGSGNGAGAASGGSAGQGTGGGAVGGNPTGGSSSGATANGGSANGGSAAGGAGSPCGNGSIFCSDFEAAAISPMLLFYPEYQRAAQTVITLDTTVFHGGKQALKVQGTTFSQMLGLTVPSKFWGRVYLRSDADMADGHNTYVTAGTGTGDPNDGEYIRIGEHVCQLELNRKSDDKEILSNGGQYMCSGGVKFLKDTWYCLEFYYDGPGQQTRVFVDNTEVAPLHTTDWGVFDYKIFKFGFEAYGGPNQTLWYDDLAIATEQVHCL
jgi:hypothetical protein